jgi:hypothetical protein
MRKLIVAATLGLVFLIVPESARAWVNVSVGIGLPFARVGFVGPAPCYPRAYYARRVYYPRGYYSYPPVYYGSWHRTVRYYGGGPYGGYRRY